MRFWKKKEKDPVGSLLGGGFDLVPSLQQVSKASGIKPDAIFLSIILAGPADEKRPPRTDILIGDGTRVAEWRVESLRQLFRGDRQPLPENEMAHYPEAYIPFFHRVEYNVLRYVSHLTQSIPTDSEMLDIYTQMRRRPDGHSLGILHDVVWQSAALVLALRPWSEAEYQAVFGQLARSTRHFRMGPSSRNYFGYLQSSFEQSGSSV